MKAEYRRDLQNNYLILEAEEAGEETGYGVRMAEQNKIRGLLPMHSARKDGKLYFHYEITSRQPLESLYEKKKMKSEEMLLLFSSLNNVLEEMHRYLLPPQHLVFDPEMIYMEPDRRGVQLCYFPGGNFPVTLLAEFILKKLEHEDARAVAIGYQFYQQAAEENFSLTDALRDILKEERRSRESDIPGVPGRTGQSENKTEDRIPGDQRQRGFSGKAGAIDSGIKEADALREEEYQVIHHERKRKSSGTPETGEKENGAAERLFSIVHPAVLISVLILTIILELLLGFGILGLTETGGCFFLTLSVGMLINRFLMGRGKKKYAYPIGEEDDEEDYGELLEEMYASAGNEKPEIVEETRCLVPQKQDEGLWLVYQGGNESGRNPETIEIGRRPSCIGKIRGESDIVLDCATVSRTHAKLERRGDTFIVQDLNSKNGTFLNGKRLLPQEEATLREGDSLLFAEVKYRVMKKA